MKLLHQLATLTLLVSLASGCERADEYYEEPEAELLSEVEDARDGSPPDAGVLGAADAALPPEHAPTDSETSR